jgi:glycosyltransferase involved in cell wall biosynthesis
MSKQTGNQIPATDVVIPAFNEQNAIGRVLEEIPMKLVRRVIVCDNNSSDETASEASKGGAIVVREPRPGYGNACLKCLEYIAQSPDPRPDIVVFLDADHSDFPEQMDLLIAPITNQNMDLVIGSRALGNKEAGSMTPQQIFGNWLATRLIRWFFKVKFTDLGPFRAIRYSSLTKMNMQDKTYGWTVEMQIKAARMGLNCCEVPVDYRKRIGQSKVSGTVKGTMGAGWKILYTIFKNIQFK